MTHLLVSMAWISMSYTHSLGREVAGEFGADHSTVSMGASHLTPDNPRFVRLTARSHCVFFGLVDVGTAFAQVEVHLISGVDALHLQQSCVFTLVPQTSLIAGKDGLGPQSSRHFESSPGVRTCTVNEKWRKSPM